jgi:hypothetical protein
MMKITGIVSVLISAFLLIHCPAGQGGDNAGRGAAGLSPGDLAYPGIAEHGERCNPAIVENVATEDRDGRVFEDILVFKYYVTPEIEIIEDLSRELDGVEGAYETAVQWVYVSENTLNNAADKWLTPNEFLTGTPYYPANPLPGEEASDCEEQASTLVSLIRAQGVGPDEVRAAVGKVSINNKATGHVWAELYVDQRWLALDPTFGPYWDDAGGKLVPRRGLPFDYYLDHTYPATEVWAYYNDIYQIDSACGAGYAPASWR